MMSGICFKVFWGWGSTQNYVRYKIGCEMIIFETKWLSTKNFIRVFSLLGYMLKFFTINIIFLKGEKWAGRLNWQFKRIPQKDNKVVS